MDGAYYASDLDQTRANRGRSEGPKKAKATSRRVILEFMPLPNGLVAVTLV